MWTFTTPPECIQNAVERKAQCQYIPEDFSRNDMCETFRAAVIELGQGVNLEQLIVVKELFCSQISGESIFFRPAPMWLSPGRRTLLCW